MPLPEPQLPELLADLLAKLEPEIAAAGVNSMEARAAARRVVELIRREWGGLQLYIPKGTSFDVEAMRRVVGEEWNGHNTIEMCRRLNVSERRLRQLHAEYQQARSPTLF